MTGTSATPRRPRARCTSRPARASASAGLAGCEDPCAYIFPAGLLFEITDGPDRGGTIVVYPAGRDDPEMALVRAIVPETD